MLSLLTTQRDGYPVFTMYSHIRQTGGDQGGAKTMLTVKGREGHLLFQRQ